MILCFCLGLVQAIILHCLIPASLSHSLLYPICASFSYFWFVSPNSSHLVHIHMYICQSYLSLLLSVYVSILVCLYIYLSLRISIYLSYAYLSVSWNPSIRHYREIPAMLIKLHNKLSVNNFGLNVLQLCIFFTSLSPSRSVLLPLLSSESRTQQCQHKYVIYPEFPTASSILHVNTSVPSHSHNYIQVFDYRFLLCLFAFPFQSSSCKFGDPYIYLCIHGSAPSTDRFVINMHSKFYVKVNLQ